MDFLTLFHKQGFSYSSINTAKSTLMTFVTVNNSSSWSSDQDLNRFLKGIYNSKPPMPRYSTTWDANIILNFVAYWMPLEDLTLKELTLKTVNSTCVWKQRSIYTRNEAEPLPRGTKPNGFLFRL